MNFNRKIIFQTLITGPDGSGGQTAGSLTDIATTNASMLPLTASRQLEDNQTVLNQIYLFTIRYRHDFMPDKTMLIKDTHTNEMYTISSVNQLGDKRQWIELRGMKKQ